MCCGSTEVYPVPSSGDTITFPDRRILFKELRTNSFTKKLSLNQQIKIAFSLENQEVDIKDKATLRNFIIEKTVCNEEAAEKIELCLKELLRTLPDHRTKCVIL